MGDPYVAIRATPDELVRDYPDAVAHPVDQADSTRSATQSNSATSSLGPTGRDDDLVFPARAGTPLLMENVRRRALRPAAEEAGAGWAGFHTFRHTCASRLFAAGRNAVQVQR